MLGRLNHVALAVPDLAAATATYRTMLGARLSEPQALPEHGVTVVFVDVGNTKIELLEPLGADSPIAKLQERNPDGGIHHLCYEVDARPSASYAGALKACALDQRRLPDAGELALVFDHLSAQQPYQWTVGYFTDTIPLAPVLGQSSSRDLLVTANSLPGDTAFRCVTSATN